MHVNPRVLKGGGGEQRAQQGSQQQGLLPLRRHSGLLRAYCARVGGV